ncbi:MAG: ankyrin repeat domain-containing protein, partial [Janthinobacterium lividum]
FYVAISKGLISEVEMLLDKEPILINFADKNGNTPLHVAVWSYQDEMAEFLIKRGADLLAIDGYHYTALHHAAIGSGKSIERIVDMLLSRQPVLAEMLDVFGQTAIYRAATTGEVALAGMFLSEILAVHLHPKGTRSEDPVIKKWLEKAIGSYDRHINACNSYKKKGLIFNSNEEEIIFIDQLFGSKACNYYKKANILCALGNIEEAIRNYEESINLEPDYINKLFINWQKEPNCKIQYVHNKFSRSMLNKVPAEIINSDDGYGGNILYLIAEAGREIDTQLLMEKMEPQMISKSICKAIENNNWKVATILVSKANLEAIIYRYEDGKTFLHMAAAQSNSNELVELLLIKMTPEAILLKDYMDRTAWLLSANKEIAEIIHKRMNHNPIDYNSLSLEVGGFILPFITLLKKSIFFRTKISAIEDPNDENDTSKLAESNNIHKGFICLDHQSLDPEHNADLVGNSIDITTNQD